MMSKENKKGWLELPIENILSPNEKGVVLGQGWSPQCEKIPSQSEQYWGVLKTTAIQSGYFLEEENKLLPSHLEPRVQHELQQGDFLITCAGPRNRCGVACLVRKTRKKLLISGKMYRFRINSSKAIPEFVEFFLLSREAWIEIDKMKTGGSDSGLNLTHSRFKKLIIPLPPLPEQQAIVSKIEALFSELDNGIQQLRTAQAQLKVYRQSLLKWAFEGKLTNKEVKEGELPEGWKVVELKNVVEKISDGPFGSNLKSNDYVEEGIRVIRLENIGVMEFRDEYKTFISTEKYESLKNHSVHKGDIIFSSFISDSVRSVILPEFIETAINKADCFLVRNDESKVVKKYLSYYFSSKALQSQFVDQIHGATRPRINTTQLKNSLIRIPSLKEQHLIVTELESKLTICDKIEETIQQSLQQAETLRQSILKQAFEGKLINMK